MSNLVKYHNDINNIPLRNLSENEINLFFSLIFKAKDQGTNTIKINFSELKKISRGYRDNERFYKSLEGLSTKLLKIIQRVEVDDKIIMFTIFNRFIIDKKDSILEIKISEDLKYLLNDLDQYTKFELLELVKLKSSYSKTMFRLLKQISKNNWRLIKFEDFKRILCIPESYKMCDIDRQILKPVIKELTPIFPGLAVEKIKKGRSIYKLNFTWESKGVKEAEKTKEIEISEKLNKIIEKTKKNRFIKPLLFNENIAYLTEKYSEKELIEGLNFAYNEIKIKITSINYLEKTIESGINKEKIKLIVKKDEPKDLQGVETKQEEQKELKKETREPIRPQSEEIKKEFMNLSKDDQEEVERIAFKLFTKESEIETITSIHKMIFKSLRGHYINKIITSIK